MPFGYIQWNFASTTSDHPLDDTQLVVLAGLGWSCHTFIFLKVRVLSLSLHFYNSFLDWTLFNFVLLAAVDYRCCIIKSRNGKSRCRDNKYIGTYCACTHVYSLYPRWFRSTWCSWGNCCWQVTTFPAKGYRWNMAVVFSVATVVFFH